MKKQLTIPHLNLFSPPHKRRAYDSPRSNRTVYHSPPHHAYKHNKIYNTTSVNTNPQFEYQTYPQLHIQIKKKAKNIYPAGYYQNMQLPNNYLDYQPQRYHTYTNDYGYRYEHGYGIPKQYNNYKWKVAQQDKIIKQQMYTQTSNIKQIAQTNQTQRRLIKQQKFHNYLKHQKYHYNNFNKINKQQQHIHQQNINIQNYTNKQIQNNHDIQQKYNQIQNNRYIHNQSNNKQYQPYQQQNLDYKQLQPQNQQQQENQYNYNIDYKNKQNISQIQNSSTNKNNNNKKTFSQALLDQLLQKQELQKYQSKYNADHKYQQIIVGKVQKTVQVILHTKKHGNQQEEKSQIGILSMEQQRQRQLRIFQNQIKNKQIIDGQNQANQRLSRQQMAVQPTVSLALSRSLDKPSLFRDSLIQTNQQSRQTNQNKKIQTDYTQSTMIMEKLIKNVIDDKQFRRRINQKTDQFNKIKMQFVDDPSLHFEQLVRSKDAYVNESQKFLNKINKLVQQKGTKRKIIIQKPQDFLSPQKISYFSTQPFPANTLTSPINRNIHMLPQNTIQHFSQPLMRYLSPSSPLPPFLSQQNPQNLPQPIKIIINPPTPPTPKQIIQYMPYRRIAVINKDYIAK